MSQTEPGWYQAAGDPPGTQRYWDGATWQGEPVPAAGAPTPPPGYVAVQPESSRQFEYASWGTRLLAYLIDVLPAIGIYVVGIALVAAGADVLGILVIIAGLLAYVVWNLVIRQGRTGQSIGKQARGIELVRDDNGQPTGAGLALGRLLVASLISNITFGIYGLLDYLWPLWDSENKRLTDKMFKMSVVRA